MGDFSTDKATNGTRFFDAYDCVLCFHGGKCRKTGHTTAVQCLCPTGYSGRRCQDTELDFEFDVGPKQETGTPAGLTMGITVAVCVVLLLAVAFFLWRNHRGDHKDTVDHTQSNRMKKLSIEGLSVVGQKPTVKSHAIPVCIAIEEENTSQEQLKLSREEYSSYTNPMNHEPEGKGSCNCDGLV